MKASRRVFFTMVCHPVNGWMRVGNAYATHKAAAEWLSFVRGGWRGWKVRISSLTVHYGDDGKLTPATLRKLDEKFNLDPPAEKASA